MKAELENIMRAHNRVCCEEMVNAIMEVISKEQTRVFMEQVVHLDKMIKELKDFSEQKRIMNADNPQYVLGYNFAKEELKSKLNSLENNE